LIWILTILLLIALAAVAPLGHRHLGLASMLYWLFSWLGQTFAPLLGLISAAFVLRILLEPGPDYLVLAVAAANVLLFAFLHLRNHRMGRALLAQLAAEVKFDDATRQSLLRFRAPALSGLIPGKGRRKDVEKLPDIAYGPHGKRNLLDIYRPQQLPAQPMPVLIHIHGGAWVVGDKDGQALPLLYHMAANGWLCVSINYRLAPADRFPAMLSDILHAIAWVKQHAAEYGGDPGFVALTGGSAGGHLSSLAALVGHNPGQHADFPDEDTRVSAVVPLYGRYDFLDRTGIWGVHGKGLTEFKSTKVMPGAPHEHPELWQLASPVDHLHADAPPFLIIHGSQDCLISALEARHFAAELREAAHADVLYAELAGAQHAFEIQMTPLTRYFIEGARHYLDYQYQNRNS
jgi:acetyl esterase/lipase